MPSPVPVPTTFRKIRLNGFCKVVKLEDDGRDRSAGLFLTSGEEAGEGVGKEDSHSAGRLGIESQLRLVFPSPGPPPPPPSGAHPTFLSQRKWGRGPKGSPRLEDHLSKLCTTLEALLCTSPS